jgi:HAAS domain-containing protein
MVDDARTRYLADLDAALPFPPEQRAEIVEEIATHLGDAVAERVERGVDPDQAEADAQGRLGSPTQLARSLARPEQSLWRLLAATGPAIWSGTGHWIYGYLFGTLIVLVGTLALAALVQAVGLLLRTGWTLQTSDGGWNSMLVATAIGFGCYFAGRVLPDRFGRRSRRLSADVRPWVVAASVPLVAAITIFVIDAPQNWASVVAYAIAPLGLVVGAWWPDVLHGRTRLAVIAIVFTLLLTGILAASVASSMRSAQPLEVPTSRDRGLAVVGPEWRPPTSPIPPAFESSSWGDGGEAIRWEGELSHGVSLAGFHDLRLEAWRSMEYGYELDPAYDAPFAVAPVKNEDGSYSADIVTTREPGVGAWTLIVTGIGEDGVRYVIDAGGGGSSTFTGSAWDWIVAVATND